MILYSTRARIGGNPAEAAAWAQEVTQLVSKTGGVDVEVAARLGGGQDLLWVTRHDNLGTLEKWLDKWQGDTKYQAMVKSALDKGLFDPGTIESTIWRTL